MCIVLWRMNWSSPGQRQDDNQEFLQNLSENSKNHNKGSSRRREEGTEIKGSKINSKCYFIRYEIINEKFLLQWQDWWWYNLWHGNEVKQPISGEKVVALILEMLNLRRVWDIHVNVCWQLKYKAWNLGKVWARKILQTLVYSLIIFFLLIFSSVVNEWTVIENMDPVKIYQNK